MEFSTTIQGINADFNLNAVKEYNQYLKDTEKFEVETEDKAFAKALENAQQNIPLNDKKDPNGMGSFMANITNSFGGALNAVNNNRLEADRLQEDMAMGGKTSIHEAMIAAEKAELSMQMAVQIRNRILNAYAEINSMAI